MIYAVDFGAVDSWLLDWYRPMPAPSEPVPPITHTAAQENARGATLAHYGSLAARNVAEAHGPGNEAP